MKSVLDRGRFPENFHVDQGKKFYIKESEARMQKYKINMYSAYMYSNFKASISEPFTEPLKNKM